MSSLPPSYQHALPALLPLGFHRNRKHIQVGYLLLDGKTLGVELFMPAVVAFRSHVHEQMVSLLRKTPRAEDDK